MSDESALTQEVGPEVIPATEQTEAVQPEAAPEQVDEQISATRARREREKAARQKQAEELADTQAKLQAAQAAKQRIVDAAKSETAPTQEEIPDPIEHAAALAVWRMSQRQATRETQAADQEVQAAQERARQAAETHKATIDQNWVDQVGEARARYADFDAVVAKAGVGMPEGMAVLIKTADQGADLAYYLGQNPETARQISLMHPVEAARALGRIEAKLDAPKARTVTGAPDPVNPVRGNATATKRPEDMDATEFAAWRRAGGTFR